ncbi:MAG: hypothetical protein AAF384_11680 [Pseudomonadota bacterium]
MKRFFFAVSLSFIGAIANAADVSQASAEGSALISVAPLSAAVGAAMVVSAVAAVPVAGSVSLVDGPERSGCTPACETALPIADEIVTIRKPVD